MYAHPFNLNEYYVVIHNNNKIINSFQGVFHKIDARLSLKYQLILTTLWYLHRGTWLSSYYKGENEEIEM